MESNINNICRNLQKKAKKTRYEQEKAFMETLRGVGCTVGEYVGDGQGELESTLETVDTGPVDVDPVDDHQHSEEDEDEDEYVDASETDDSHPLLIMFDCETTGFSIYSDHITDIAAKVVASPVPVHQPTFTSLVRTSKNIPAAGKHPKNK